MNLRNLRMIHRDQRDARRAALSWRKDCPKAKRATPDLVVLDPPRQGCASSVLQGVFHELKPQRAIYVSCNPEAFAGELPGMLDAGYTLDRVQPVDMFPHTDHVELVATLSAARRASR